MFTRPAHLDALIARLDSGESFAEDVCGRDRHRDRDSSRYEGCNRRGRYGDRYGDISDSPPLEVTELEHELEDMRRELTVTHMQATIVM